jgi:hypothetical protein
LQTRGDVATAPGAAPGAAYTTAGSTANTGAIAAGSSGYGTGATGGHGDDQTEEQRKVCPCHPRIKISQICDADQVQACLACSTNACAARQLPAIVIAESSIPYVSGV